MIIKVSVVILLLFSTSCYVNRHTINNGPVGKEEPVEVYSKAKQLYLFWGLARISEVNPRTPDDGNYQIKTCFNGSDILISFLTGGIVETRSVKIYTKTK